MTDLFTATPGGIRLSVRVTPGGGRNAISGMAADADGNKFLRVVVTAAPENGKANAAVVKLLAKTWKVPKSAIRVAAGATGRRKTLEITGDARQVAERINATVDEMMDGTTDGMMERQ